MFVHIFAFRWNPHATKEERDRAYADIRTFAGRIPGLHNIRIGENVSTKSKAFSLTGVMVFDDQSAYEAYQAHELHVRLLDWLVPLIDAIEFDFTC